MRISIAGWALLLMLVYPVAQAVETAPAAVSITLEEAVQQVQTKTDGRILSADRVRSGRANTYRIKVLMNDGRVRVLEVDSKPNKVAESSADPAQSKEKD